LLTALHAPIALLAGDPNTNRSDSIPPVMSGGQVTNQVSRSRTLQPNDILTVSVYQQADLNTRVTIDDRGAVILPLLGRVEVGGKTLVEATEHVQKLYDSDYLVNPVVTIQVEQIAALRFSVLGEVQRPGFYEIPTNESISLLEGIAKAGGFTRLAAPSKVTIQRIENGVPKIYTINAEAMSKDTRFSPFRLQPGDVVTVIQRIF
jgi:polysaccharide export outer membrane protein